MAFQFVASDIGPKERRLIRSHVMIGKNAGRPRPSRRKQRDVTVKQSASHLTSTPSRDINTEHLSINVHIRPLVYDRLISNDLAFTDFPHQSAESVELLRQYVTILDKRLYPEEFCSKLDFINYVWLQYMFYDAGHMHGVLAIKSSFSEYPYVRAKNPSCALEHLSKAYQLTQERLRGSNAISDEAIAGVTILVLYQLVHGQADLGLVHFNGLCAMIQMRGGLAKLMKHSRSLAQKPWRIDLEIALQAGLPMRFEAAGLPIRSTTDSLKPIHSTYTTLCEDGVSTKLICILSDITAFVQLLNAMKKTDRLDPLDFSERAFLLIQQLIDFHPLKGPNPINSVENILQLALLALMTTALPNYQTIELPYNFLVRKLKVSFQSYIPTTSDHQRFLLWAVFVGRVSIMRDAQDEWVLPLVQSICQRLEIDTWSQIRTVLSDFCWIHQIHDKVAIKVLEKVEKRGVRMPRPDDLTPNPM